MSDTQMASENLETVYAQLNQQQQITLAQEFIKRHVDRLIKTALRFCFLISRSSLERRIVPKIDHDIRFSTSRIRC